MIKAGDLYFSCWGVGKKMLQPSVFDSRKGEKRERKGKIISVSLLLLETIITIVTTTNSLSFFLSLKLDFMYETKTRFA